MMEKSMRKEQGIAAALPPPELEGPKDADVTLIGWGSTEGTIRRSPRPAREAGNYRQSVADSLARSAARRSDPRQLRNAKRTIIVENNYSGQFARYLRSETSFVPDGHIRKYDGEPFMPHHIVEAVREQLAGDTTLSVPTHEIMV
jgi:2-oxoglutarate ferredoxin oxidoreductase subunit alpha